MIGLKFLSPIPPICLGFIALFIWALTAVTTAYIKVLPTFEVLAIVFSVSFSFTALMLTYTRRWYVLRRQPKVLWLAGVLGIYGNDILYLTAFKYAPAAQADLINYLWPIFVVIFSGLLSNRTWQPKYFIAALLGFIGVYVLLTSAGSIGFDSQYSLGYALALLDAMVWTFYVLIAARYVDSPSEMIGIYCGIGAVLSAICHFNFEITVIPNALELLVLIFMGLTSQCLAYLFYDYALKYADATLLTTSAYLTPILSVLLLVLFGYADLSLSLLIATVFVVLGALLGAIDWQSGFFIKLFQQKLLSPPVLDRA